MVEHLIPGQEVFQSNCSACHGDLGNAMISGAKDLTQSHLNQQEIMLIIKKGKGNMLAYESILTEEEINDLSHYVLSLRTP